MKTAVQRALVSAVCIVVLTLIAGCEQQQGLSGTKKSRLVSAENIELKKQLRLCNEQIKKQQELLKEQSKENIEDLIGTVFMQLADENQKLRDENDALKAQLEELKKQATPNP